MYVDYYGNKIQLNHPCVTYYKPKNEDVYVHLNSFLRKRKINSTFEFSDIMKYCGAFLSLELAIQILEEENFQRCFNMENMFPEEIVYQDEHFYIVFEIEFLNTLEHFSDENPFEFFL